MEVEICLRRLIPAFPSRLFAGRRLGIWPSDMHACSCGGRFSLYRPNTHWKLHTGNYQVTWWTAAATQAMSISWGWLPQMWPHFQLPKRPRTAFQFST